MKKQTKVDLVLAEYMAEKGWLKQFALFIQVKAKYDHTIVYNYSHNSLAKKVGLNPKTVKRYTKKLINMHFCEFHGKNLLFRTPQKIKEDLDLIDERRPPRYIETRPWTSFQGILDRIHNLLLDNNSRQQRYNIIRHCGTYNGKKVGLRELKKALRNRDRQPEAESNDKVLFSTRQVGKLLNVSHTTAHRILNRLKKNKYIRIKQIIEKTKVNPGKNPIHFLKSLNMFNPGYYFLKDNVVYWHRGSQIQFL